MIVPRPKSLLLFFLVLLAGQPLAAHVVRQFYGELRRTGDSWQLEILFDAGYAVEEWRNDPDAPQPQRQWLADLSRDRRERLLSDAENYLQELLVFTHGDEAVSWTASYPDFQTTPPDLPVLLNDGAYFHVLIEPAERDDGNALTLSLASGKHPDLVVRLPGTDEDEFLVIRPGETGELSPDRRRSDVAWTAFIQGILHVVPDGLDHILFVLAIFLLQRKWKPLIRQSLLFTAAHTLTLGLAAAGLVNVPGSIVEPLIALSIAALAIENLFIADEKPWRHALVFAFGLVHGLGFAGVLSTWIRPGEGFLATLFCANAGVEVAQAAILGVAWIATIGWHRTPAYPWFRLVACVVLAAAGFWWFFERIGWIQ